MAVPIPSPILDSVLKQLDSLGQSSELNWALHTQLQKLRSNLELIGDVLEEVELMGFLFPDVCRQWVRDIEDVLYAADDLLDEALTRSIPAATGSKVGKVRLTMSNLSFFQVTLPHQLKSRVNKKVEKIVERWCEYNLIVEPTTSNTSSSTSAAAGTTAGRNGEKKGRAARKGILRNEYDPEKPSFLTPQRRGDHDKVKGMLLGDADNKIVWILGGPGVGKTTVCRTLYDEKQVEERFEIRLWVRLDGPDSYIPLLKKIATSLSKKGKIESQVLVPEQHKKEEPIEKDDEEEEGWLIMKIKRLLCGRRFLLVLDNYPPLPRCLPGSEAWIAIPDRFAEKLRSLVTEEESQGRTAGNKILITRLSGEMFGWLCPSGGARYKIESFSQADVDGLSLFYHTTLGQERPETTWQKTLGEKIVGNCEGNPALIRCIGTFLKGRDDRASWDRFASGWRYPNKRYYHRIAELYYSFRKSLHFVGHSYLLSRGGLFKYQDLVSQVAASGLPDTSERMKKWFRKAILLEQKSEDLWDDDSSYKLIPSSLQLDLFDPPLRQGLATTRFEAIYEPPASPSSTARDDRLHDNVLTSSNLARDCRSFVSLGDDSNMRMPEPELEAFVSRFRSLRVLDLSSTGIQNLPRSISRLSHLRYLDLSRNNFRELPRSICRLKKLETLKLVYCDKLVKLPRDMHRLAHSLKIIRLDMCLHLTGMPRAMSRLTGLKTLDRFVVSGQRGGLGYLKKLDKLGGRLSLELPIWWNDSAADARKADLKSKTGITELQVNWPGVGQDDVTRDTVDGLSNDQYKVLERLQPNSALKKLSITNFGGIEFPTWITESQLSEISISKCKRCQRLPPFDKMPNLKSLTLTSMDVEYMQYEHPNPQKKFFPSLEKLRIGNMCNLKGWYVDWESRRLPKFPKLDFVEIWKCGNLATLPRFADISELTLQDVPEKLFEWICGRGFGEVRINSIQNLRINSIQNLAFLPNQFIGLITETLIIEDCSELKTLGASDQGNKRQDVSQRLQRLEFKGLKKLKLVLQEGLRHLCNLTELKISEDIEDLNSIYEGEDMVMPWEGLKKLKNLEIRGFKRLQALPNNLQNLSSLRKLAVVECQAMKYMSNTLKELTNLKELEISTCSEDVDCLHERDEEDVMPWKAIEMLYKLKIQGFKELKSLPKSLENLGYIWELEIIHCPALVKVDCVYDGDEMENRTIWKELRVASLKIEGCGKLEALPEGIRNSYLFCKLMVTDCKALKDVPEWKAQDVENFYFLKIKSCPEFSKEIKQRIKKDSFHKMDDLQLLEEGSSNDDIPFYMKPDLEIYYE